MLTKNFGGRKNERRISAVERLKAQLESGKKEISVRKALNLPAEEQEAVATLGGTVPLTKEDEKRIKKEIAVLESRILAPQAAAARRTKKYRGGSR